MTKTAKVIDAVKDITVGDVQEFFGGFMTILIVFIGITLLICIAAFIYGFVSQYRRDQ